KGQKAKLSGPHGFQVLIQAFYQNDKSALKRIYRGCSKLLGRPYRISAAPLFCSAVSTTSVAFVLLKTLNRSTPNGRSPAATSVIYCNDKSILAVAGVRPRSPRCTTWPP